jgi:hypothetical protein
MRLDVHADVALWQVRHSCGAEVLSASGLLWLLPVYVSQRSHDCSAKRPASCYFSVDAIGRVGRRRAIEGAVVAVIGSDCKPV